MAQVTGVVNDANNFPEMDAEVVVKGTDKVAYTDENGKFDIDAKIGDVLIINGKEFTVTSNNLGVVKYAEEDVTLQEVIVTAYGTQTKESLTGSVGEVKSEELAKVTSGNVVQGMTGKIAGVQIVSNNGLPGTAPNVRFRGIGSINGSSAPLYVVDGVPFNGDVSGINNQDIESISFLKDASAAALYGNRGANGVIIITTKKGVKGKTRYTLDLKSGVAMRGVPEYNISKNAAGYYEDYHRMLKNTSIHNGSSEADAHTFASNNLITGSNGLAYNVTNVANNAIIGADGKFNSNASILYQEDWADFMFKDGGFYTNTYFSANGATDDTSYFFSVGYEKNDTYMVNSTFEKFTGRLKVDNKIGDRIKVGGNLAYTLLLRNMPDGFDGGTSYSNPFQWTRNIAPIYPLYAYDAQGNAVYTSNGDRAYDDGTGVYSPFVRPYGGMQNPYATALYDVKKSRVNQVFANTYATFNILEGLDFTYSVTGEFANNDWKSLDTSLYGDAVGVNGRVYNSMQNTYSITQQQLLTYKKRINDHNFDVLLGHETMDRQVDFLEAHSTNGLLVDSPYLNHYALLRDATGNGTPYATEGFFARFNYDYGNKYYINANVRRDGSSRFHPDNRWGNFFGVGAAWRVSQEAFLKNSKVINELKLKASYGEQGNDNLGYNFPYKDLYTIVQTTNAGETAISYNQTFKGNKDITWETNANLNAGIELALFNSRVTVDAEYFLRKSQDMLYMRPLNVSEGFSSYPENIGDMENRGFEVTVNADVIRTKDFRLGVFANVTTLTNEITKLPENNVVSGSYLLREGESMYSWYLREYAGVNQETGAAQFYKVDATTGEKTITENHAEATLQFIGKNAVAKVYGGFGLNMDYKGLDFGVNFAYQAGGWGYDSQYMTLFDGGRGETFHNDYANTWTSENRNAALPVVIADNAKQYYSTSTLGLIKSDYISLQNISLGYTFKKGLVDNLGLTALRVYALADNVWVWSKRKGYDPRMSYTGISDTTYSPIRTISAGVNFAF
ncbi:SusC/RagA family TonB-linked outer membrane protein [Faecalibacter bovis]|uniref:SusC/RagA family TonB-linked outer membrane protein n=2 Tax=Faecalibacter bovis TaxID=2898187 RepID=A0ABX7XGQ7_9FLAO|nr:SusC/RagA family TonB-linked outer membrane protein [Faecalibacter bovis]